MSFSLLTDRTLFLRELEDMSAVVQTSKCIEVLAKYNATRIEVLCVCSMICPWRPSTDEEMKLYDAWEKNLMPKARLRQIFLGISYPLIFIIGVTGRAFQPCNIYPYIGHYTLNISKNCYQASTNKKPVQANVCNDLTHYA